MNTTPRIWSPVNRPADCHDWLSPEDALRHALAAYTLALTSLIQPPGRRFAEPDGSAWSSRQAFADDLALLFEMRIKAEGYQLGVCGDWRHHDLQLQKWRAPRCWDAEDLRQPECQQAGA